MSNFINGGNGKLVRRCYNFNTERPHCVTPYRTVVLGPGNPGSGVVKSGLVLIFFEAKNILIFNWPNRFEFFAIRKVLHFGAVKLKRCEK